MKVDQFLVMFIVNSDVYCQQRCLLSTIFNYFSRTNTLSQYDKHPNSKKCDKWYYYVVIMYVNMIYIKHPSRNMFYH
jgi:hypothetical protein